MYEYLERRNHDAVTNTSSTALLKTYVVVYCCLLCYVLSFERTALLGHNMLRLMPQLSAAVELLETMLT